MKEQIEFNEFLEIEKRLEIATGKVTTVEEIPKADKLIKLTVDFGGDERTVVTNIKPHLGDITALEGKEMLFVTNLKPAKMMGITSTAMILPGDEIEKNGNFITVNGDSGINIL